MGITIQNDEIESTNEQMQATASKWNNLSFVQCSFCHSFIHSFVWSFAVLIATTFITWLQSPASPVTHKCISTWSNLSFQSSVPLDRIPLVVHLLRIENDDCMNEHWTFGVWLLLSGSTVNENNYKSIGSAVALCLKPEMWVGFFSFSFHLFCLVSYAFDNLCNLAFNTESRKFINSILNTRAQSLYRQSTQRS